MLQNGANHEDLTLSSRYECKYRISPLMAPAVRQFVQPFMRPDPYAARHPDFRYPICSLYLDSEDLVLYQQTVGGEKNRFKLRVRTYSDKPDDPAFFEVKRKINNIVRKRRARMERRQAEALLQGRSLPPGSLRADAAAELAHFENYASLISAKPVLRVRYLREAYESRGGDPVRVTLDTELAYAPSLDGDLRHAAGRWSARPVGAVILELKFTDNFPAWVRDLVRTFGLKQQPVPKYVMCVEHLMTNGSELPLAIAGVTLPLRRV